jgi:ribonuclease HII
VTLAHLGAEAYRLQLLSSLEGDLRRFGFERIAGLDEAGRGSLAGPVVAAAVVMDPENLVPGVDDSKRLSPARRQKLARWIRQAAHGLCVTVVSAAMIDRLNILGATRRAMVEALEALRPAPDLALIDAVALEGLAFPSLSVVRGESLSYSIACASILAKVERDQMMSELHQRYPHYGFDSHKGYGAREHLQALGDFGPCPEHRLTFRSVLPSAGAG